MALTEKQIDFKTWDPYSFSISDKMYTPWPPQWTIHYYYDSFCLECEFFDTEEEAQEVLKSLDDNSVPARLYSPDYILDDVIMNFLDDDLDEEFYE